IPRGTTFIELEYSGNTVFELVIYGNKKFTGGLGDDQEEPTRPSSLQVEAGNDTNKIKQEDKSPQDGKFSPDIRRVKQDFERKNSYPLRVSMKQELWRDYCLQDPENAEKIVCTNKLNGEAAHFSGRYIEGQFYIITGSKFVHMLIRNEEDIKLYDGNRYK
ncbi:unnamed protein product, partial [Meganyctiphanes norvegica]